MATVLLFNIPDAKGVRIKNLCRKLYFEYRDVDRKDFGLSLSRLLDGDTDGRPAADADFDEEMLYLADVEGGMLSIFLAQLRRVKATVDLKAVKTDTNVDYTACQLYREIKAEREAIARGGQAH